MEANLEAIKQRITPVLKAHHVVRAAIFGSYARGDMTENSDLDILVELEADKSLLDLVGLKLELEAAVGRRVDLVEYPTIRPRLRQPILREQVPVL